MIQNCKPPEKANEINQAWLQMKSVFDAVVKYKYEMQAGTRATSSMNATGSFIRDLACNESRIYSRMLPKSGAECHLAMLASKH